MFCSAPERKTAATGTYENWNDTVDYVGMNTCKTCHLQIYETFINTGMGKSFGIATPAKSSARFDAHDVIYDSTKNFYYKPLWKDSLLYILEFRMEGKDTVYKREQKVTYIVGSGQHTNSHIWQSNGYLYQAPMTFYTQKGIWQLPPGFEDGMNTRWGRIISVECMNCHNMYSAFDTSSLNKFTMVQQGIQCERCHGPGEAHVNAKLKGIIVNTDTAIDYSIVNPKKLSRDMQVELCQRCHMQGISVLNDGATFFDFKPGQPLNTVMNVFMPRYEGGEGKFIMASHADRMKQSNCYLHSQMTCLTCHNPHLSVKVTPPETFNAACVNCHASAGHTCKLPMEKRNAANDNCFNCHMPVSETLDIPNVTVHDHRIHVPIGENKKQEIQKFVGLECMTTKNPSPLLMAEGYLQTFEAFSPQPYLLDSVLKYLAVNTDRNSNQYRQAEIRYYYLKQNYEKVTSLAQDMRAENLKDAWTAYRIGEGFYQQGNYERAASFYRHAVLLKSLDPEFGNKYGSALMALKKIPEAKDIFQRVVQEHPEYAPALSNLGYVYFLQSDFSYAGTLYDKALALDPDYEQALMNKIALLVLLRKNDEAAMLARRVLRINPANEKARMVLRSMGS